MTESLGLVVDDSLLFLQFRMCSVRKQKTKRLEYDLFPKFFTAEISVGKKNRYHQFSFRKEEEISYPDFHEVNLNPDAPCVPGSKLPLFPYK